VSSAGRESTRHAAQHAHVRRIRRSIASATALLLALFFIFLYVQLASGHDPVLGSESRTRQRRAQHAKALPSQPPRRLSPHEAAAARASAARRERLRREAARRAAAEQSQAEREERKGELNVLGGSSSTGAADRDEATTVTTSQS
jgi:hypothetical protein